MERTYIDDKTFDKVDFLETAPVKGDYENCTFINCNFANADISDVCFLDSVFEGCNLSTAKILKTSFRDIKFTGCKLLGLQFSNCSDFLFSVSFDDCILNFSSFYKFNLKNTRFKNCALREVDFTEANLAGSVFDNCDLAMAAFENTILEKADFRTAYNYSLNPEVNRLKKAKFSLAGIAGLLHKYDIEIE